MHYVFADLNLNYPLLCENGAFKLHGDPSQTLTLVNGVVLISATYDFL